MLSGRKQRVHFPRRWPRVNLVSQLDQRIGVLAHRADHHHHLVACLLRGDSLPGCRENLVGIRQAGAAEFLDDDAHGLN